MASPDETQRAIMRLECEWGRGRSQPGAGSPGENEMDEPMDDRDPLDVLRDAQADLVALRFPRLGENSAFADLYVDIADYDGYVAGIASHLVAGKKPSTR